MGLWPYWHQIETKIYYIPEVSKIYDEKGHLC